MLSDLSGDTNRGFLRTFAAHIRALFLLCAAQHITASCCPLQDDLICLPPKVAAPLGNMGPVVFCSRVTNTVQLTDPLTLRTVPLEVSRAVTETGSGQWKLLHNVLAALHLQTLQLVLGMHGLLAPLCSTERHVSCDGLLCEAAPAAGVGCTEPAHNA